MELDGSETPRPAIGDTTLTVGEWIKGAEAGGGGYGDPLQRDPDRVRQDVLENWVSIESARDVYGVVLAGSGEKMSVDGSASCELRKQLSD